MSAYEARRNLYETIHYPKTSADDPDFDRDIDYYFRDLCASLSSSYLRHLELPVLFYMNRF